MKRASFDERVARCMARFTDIEMRTNEQRERIDERKFDQRPTPKPVRGDTEGFR